MGLAEEKLEVPWRGAQLWVSYLLLCSLFQSPAQLYATSSLKGSVRKVSEAGLGWAGTGMAAWALLCSARA